MKSVGYPPYRRRTQSAHENRRGEEGARVGREAVSEMTRFSDSLNRRAVMVGAGWVVPAVLIASTPGPLTAAAVAFRPPSPHRLRSLGWSLVGASVLTAVIIVAAARLR